LRQSFLYGTFGKYCDLPGSATHFNTSDIVNRVAFRCQVKNLLATCIVILFFISCKKEQDETGLKLAVNGPETYAIEIIVGTPVKEVVDISQWRPDVVFWAQTKNTFVPLKAGEYTIVFQNLSNLKILSKVTTVKYDEVVTINVDL
jgi:hypothetical protein